LDARIYVAAYGGTISAKHEHAYDNDWFEWTDAGGNEVDCAVFPHYTASIDALLEVVAEKLPETYWCVGWDWEVVGPFAYVGSRTDPDNQSIYGRTAVLSLAIAIVKALEQ
tara:strand:+ start:482 stop:814 length:333 start_codon:yes stop_codon:yes gene_type:complete